MPSIPIGTRVRRAPGWRWGDQDVPSPLGNSSLGTVISHRLTSLDLEVKWDNGHQNCYASFRDVRPVTTDKKLEDFS